MPLVTCQTCGKNFNAKPGRVASGRGKFCSRKCAGTSRRVSKPVRCEWCRKEVASRHPDQKYCSRTCAASAAHSTQHQTLPEYRICKVCGNAFPPKSITDIYCNKRCYRADKYGNRVNYGLFEDPWASGAIPPDRYGKDLYRMPDAGLGF